MADRPSLEDLREREFLTPKESVRLGYFVSVAAAATRRSRDLPPAYHKAGTRIRYSRNELVRWLLENDDLICSGRGRPGCDDQCAHRGRHQPHDADCQCGWCDGETTCSEKGVCEPVGGAVRCG